MTLKGAVRAAARAAGSIRSRIDLSRSARRVRPRRRSAARSAWAPRRSCGCRSSSRWRSRAFVFANREFRATREMLVGGLVIGAGDRRRLVRLRAPRLSRRGSGDARGEVRRDQLRPRESYSFTAPVAYLIELLMLWTDQSRIVTFGIAGVLGMIVGSAAMALATRTFRWEGFANVEDLGNHIVGGIADGLRRRDRARLHDRPGPDRHLDARGRLDPRRSSRSSGVASRRSATRCGASSATS